MPKTNTSNGVSQLRASPTASVQHEVVPRCSYCQIADDTLVKCSERDCNRWFCNNKQSLNKSHIFFHLSESRHRRVSLASGHPLECNECDETNTLKLSVAKSNDVVILLCSDKCMNDEIYEDCHRLSPLITENMISTHIVEKSEQKTLKGIQQPSLREIKEKELKWKLEARSIDTDDEYNEKDFVTQFLAHTKEEYESADRYAKTFIPIIKEEDNCQKERCKNLTQTKVKITVVRRNGKCYATLDRTNEDHFSGTLKPGDELYLIDEKSNTPFKVRVDFFKSHNELIRVVLERDAECLNETSTFTVTIVFIDVTTKRLLQGLYDFSKNELLSEGLRTLILGRIEITDSEENGISTPQLPYDLSGDLSETFKFKLNESQQEAVRKALEPSPLVLIQGPPGTGKTRTLTATIVQFMKNIKGHHKILVCAPSNLAVDNITEELVKYGLGDSIVRIYAFSRQNARRRPVLDDVALHNLVIRKENQQLSLLKQSRDEGRDLTLKERHELNDLQRSVENQILSAAKIVCCTCVTAADRKLEGFFFKYVFIDEAAQATEPECLLPMLHHAEKVVLAGDHKQIGPIIISKKAEAAGLNKSLFERMMLVAESCLLEIQYRMHPMISEFPSNNFYEGKLKTVPNIKRPINTEFSWPKRSNPLFFCHINGMEEIPPTGVSFLNREEAQFVIKMIDNLKKAGVKQTEIGIITPYNGQKNHLMKTFEENPRYKDIDIASVDGFQGREKNYIIISCVRSNKEIGVGFLCDEKRLNVAITRAKFGMIICGNAELLARDSNWREALKFYKQKGILVESKFGEWIESQVNISGEK